MLHEGAEGEALLIYKNPNVDWTAYHKVMVDPVTIWLGNDSKLKEVSPEIRRRLANDLWAKVVEALADDYESVRSLRRRHPIRHSTPCPLWYLNCVF